MYSCDCGKSFTRSDNLRRHQLQSCQGGHSAAKRIKLDTVASTPMYTCNCCNVTIPASQISSHKRTLQHKNNACVQVSDGIQIIRNAFKCRIVSYRVESPNVYTEYMPFFNEIRDKVIGLLEEAIKVHKIFKVNMEVFGSYIVQTRDLSDTKSFNSQNKIVDQSTDLNALFDGFRDVIIAQTTEFEERDSVQNGDEKPPQHKEIEEEDIDIIEKTIGILGRWHIWVCLIIFLVKFPVAWHQLSIVFVAPRVDVSCLNNSTYVCSKNCTNYLFDTSVFKQTIATEWDLICDKEYLVKLSQTVTMLGILFGNMIFGYLSDRFGRRNPLVCAVIIQGFSGCAAAFAPWFSLFLVMRFLAALATGGTMITSFVLIMEIVGTKWRTVVGILYQIPFNLGHLLMPLISYYERDWRYFQAAISAPSLALCIYYWILPESPRWQLAVGNKAPAIETLKKAAKCNKLPTEKIEQDVDFYLERKKEKQADQRKANILDLVRTPIMRMYTIAVGFNWLVCGLCFFGVSQFIGQIAGNIFINVAVSAVIQVPGTLVACWITKAWGRKKTLIFADILAGLSVLAIVLVPENTPWMTTTLASLGMFGLALSFPTVYIYSGELYPTVLRNLGVGTSSMFARIGSMVAPFVATLDTVQPWIPPIIFGIIPLIGAILCYKLPETLDCKLPDTIEEAEEFDKRKVKKTNDDTEMK